MDPIVMLGAPFSIISGGRLISLSAHAPMMASCHVLMKSSGTHTGCSSRASCVTRSGFRIQFCNVLAAGSTSKRMCLLHSSWGTMASPKGVSKGATGAAEGESWATTCSIRATKEADESM